MAKLKHPTVKDVKVEIPDSQVDAWLEQGWIRTDRPKKSDKD